MRLWQTSSSEGQNFLSVGMSLRPKRSMLSERHHRALLRRRLVWLGVLRLRVVACFLAHRHTASRHSCTVTAFVSCLVLNVHSNAWRAGLGSLSRFVDLRTLDLIRRQSLCQLVGECLILCRVRRSP